MKKIINLLIISSFLLFGGCKKFLDINKNPNNPTGPIAEEYILPKTIVEWAAFQPYSSSHGEDLMGYTVNPGGVSGWGTLVNYNYSPGNYRDLWSVPYDNLEDIEAVIRKSLIDPNYVVLGAAAKVFKVLHYQHLVDTYNNVPYTEANRGVGNLTPAYTNGVEIYKAIADSIDVAISEFNKGGANPSALQLTTSSDPLFKGNLTLWKKFANTIKLRLILRAGSKVNFTNKTFSPDGFLTEDALVQPGYSNVTGKLNPTWRRTYEVSGATTSGANYASALNQRVPSFYTVGFYDGNKIYDKFRGSLTYRVYPSPGINQLGHDPGSNDAAKVKAPNDWYIATGTVNATNYASIGIFKGPSAPQSIMLAAESYFLQAEGIVRGIITGNAKEAFNNGILQSFRYLNKNEAGSISNKFVNVKTGKIATAVGVKDTIAIDPLFEFNTYLTENQDNYLVNFDLATDNNKKIEAIITQKYIANNMINGIESWNEYRRTGYPANTIPSVANKYTSFVSLQSLSTAPDKLPTRIQYPQEEFIYNSTNVNAQKGSGANGGISVFIDKIFWAK